MKYIPYNLRFCQVQDYCSLHPSSTIVGDITQPNPKKVSISAKLLFPGTFFKKSLGWNCYAPWGAAVLPLFLDYRS